MKENEIVGFVKSGKIVAYAEWRSATAETRNGQTTKGAAWSIAAVTHRVEIGPEQHEVIEELPKGTPTEGYKPPFQKGARVLIEYALKGPEKGLYRITGKLHSIDA